MPTSAAHLWIDSPQRLAEFLKHGPQPAVIGVDTEFMRRNTYYPKLALLQIRLGETNGLIDPLAFTPGEELAAVLGKPSNTCVMHSAGEDMEAMAELLPHGPWQLFDTQIAAAMTGMGAGMSYQKLVLAITGEELDKGETRSDWLQRPLTESQRDYAALDVVHLHVLHDHLHARLSELGRLEWLAEDCVKVCHRAERDDIDPQPQRSLRAASDWPREKQALLRRLLLWREHTARALDKPKPWLIDDKLALSLAEQTPRSLDELQDRVRGQRAMRHAQCKALFDEVGRPLQSDETDMLAPIPPAPSRDDRKDLSALKQAVDERAGQLNIPAGLLCPRRLLEELLMTRTWPEGLDGWRRPLLEPLLTPLLPNA